MSRIPVPTHSARPHSPAPPSIHFPSERAESPSPAQYRPNVHVSRGNINGNLLTSTTSMSSLSGYQNNSLSVSDSRKKQSKRDEVPLSYFRLHFFPRMLSTVVPCLVSQAIRKKIESELSRKRTISTNHTQRSRRSGGGKVVPTKGTVAALKPSPALTVPEASQLCAAKRTDCVLVVDDEEGLSGIFTAKDLAYRVRDSPFFNPLAYMLTLVL